jgi:hypothetical protein
VKSMKYLKFYAETDSALSYAKYNDYGNATYQVSLAQKTYDELNDPLLKPKLDGASEAAATIKRGKDVIVYGGIGVIALIVLLIVASLALVVIYFTQKGGLKALTGMIEDKDPQRDVPRSRYDSMPRAGGGLRDLRGKAGESIGDSANRRRP